MKNAKDVRKELSQVFQDLKDGKIDVKEAAEFANLAGKIINSAKVQIEYLAVTKQTQKIDFLHD